MDHEQYLNLERSFIGIRDERNFRANTATRIGTAFLELLRMIRTGEFDEVTFNSVTNKPSFLQGLYTYGSIILGDYIKGLQGGIITEEAFAELKDLWVREHAKIGDGSIHHDAAGRPLPALEVDGDTVFSGNLSSPEFISGFLSGLGWAIQKKEFVNSVGVTETKYSLEIDNLTVRNTLRVFEMIISQLRGENDNYVFAAMMEVDHYDPLTGKVWLSTNSGKSYMNFRKGDYIMVQRFQPGNDYKSGGDGYIVKSYELVVLDCGSGGEKDPKDENGDRLDWVRFKNFTTQMVFDDEDPAHGDVDYVGTYHSEEEIDEIDEPVFMGPERLIAKGDTFCRIDNETDPERKGLMTITSVGPSTPYMDIMYGRKTDPTHALKSRIGNLEGIRSQQFGWLQGFGAYINNLYAVGSLFNSQTGESYESRIEATKESMKMLYRETLYDINESDNKLSNGFFQKGLDDWSVVDVDGDDLPSEPEVECGEKYTDPDTGKETVDWFLKDATGEEEVDGMTVSDGSSVEVDGDEMSVPLLFNGQVIVQKRLVAELTTVEGVQVLHLCNAGISQDFSVVKPNFAHKKLTVDDEEFEVPTKPENRQPNYEEGTYKYWENERRDMLRELWPQASDEAIEDMLHWDSSINWIKEHLGIGNSSIKEQVDYLSSTEDEMDRLYLGVRILPLTDGVLRVGFLGKGEMWSIGKGVSVNCTKDVKWSTVSKCDHPEDDESWYFPADIDEVRKQGRFLVSYSGECYIRFVVLQNDPIDENEHEYETLFEQNARRIRMQAKFDDQQFADWTIQYNAIAQRVTDNRKLADQALKDILGIEYDENTGMYSFPDKWVNPDFSYASWIIHTKSRLDTLFVKWDDDNNLVGYSNRTQTADFIEEVIAGTATPEKYKEWGASGENLINAFKDFHEAWDDALSDGILSAEELGRLKSLYRALGDMYRIAESNKNKILLSDIIKDDATEKAKINTGWNALSQKKSELETAFNAVLSIPAGSTMDSATLADKTKIANLNQAIDAFETALKDFNDIIGNANNFVSKTLAERVTAAKKVFTDYQDALDSAIAGHYNGDVAFLSWVKDTAISYVKVKGVLDENGNLKNFSTVEQTSEDIRMAVVSANGYSDRLKSEIDTSVLRIKSDLETSIGEVSDSAAASASWIDVNSKYTAIVAANWGADGKLLSNSSIVTYGDGILLSAKKHAEQKVSDLSVTVDGIQTQVTNNKSELDTDIGNINSTITNSILPDILTAQNTANEAKGTANSNKAWITNASWITQKKDQIIVAAGAFNASGKLLNTAGLVTTSDFSGLFASSYDTERKEINDESSWEQGYYQGSTKIDSNYYIRTKNLIPITSGTTFYVNEGYTLRVGRYDSSGIYINQKTGLVPDAYGRVTFDTTGVSFVSISISKSGTISMSDLSASGLYQADTKIATSAEISVFVDNFGTSNAKIKADNINFNFTTASTWYWNKDGTGQVQIMKVTKNGLEVNGQITAKQTSFEAGDAEVDNITNITNITVKDSGSLVIGNLKLVYDQPNNALKLVNKDGSTAANFVATGAVSALGSGSSSGGGGGLSLEAVWASLSRCEDAYSSYQIDENHLTYALSKYLTDNSYAKTSAVTKKLTIMQGDTKLGEYNGTKATTITITGGESGDYLELSGGTLTGSLTATQFIITGGTASQFLKADGSVDSGNYKKTTVSETTAGTQGLERLTLGNSKKLSEDGAKYGILRIYQQLDNGPDANPDKTVRRADIVVSSNLTGNRIFTIDKNANDTFAMMSDIPSTDNFVDTSSTQSISGAKTFTSAMTVNANITSSSKITSTNGIVTGYLTVGQSSQNTSYNLYVKGKGYFTGKVYSEGNEVLTAGNAVTLDSVQTISAAKIFSVGLKSKSISIETAIDGKADNDRAGEINRYGSALHLQYHNQTGYTAGGVTMCYNGGSVAIGYSSPDSSYKLKVNGKVRITDQIGINADVASDAQCMLNINGSAKALSWGNYSDIRQKDFIEDVDCDFEVIARAPIFNFTWNNIVCNRVFLGTSAQYWRKVFPHAVVADAEGYLSMDYSVTALASAVMTARKVLDHEEDIAALKRKVRELEQEVERLKAA